MNNKNYTVYMHISPSNKRYIGITSMKPEHRWNNGRGYSHNIYFTNAINKYGWDNFQHIIVARGLTEDETKWLEIELIKVWDTTNRENGYNQTKGGDGSNGLSPSEETRKKMSESRSGERNGMYGVHRYGEEAPMYGKHHSEETIETLKEKNSGKNNPNAKAVICLTTMKKFDTAEEGAEYYNTAGTHIVKCCKNKNRFNSSGKLEDGTPLVWTYYEDYLNMTEEEIDNKLKKADTRIICITTKKVFATLNEGAKEYKITSIGNLSECCRGKKKSCGKLEDGTKLQWKLYKDYLEEQENNNN